MEFKLLKTEDSKSRLLFFWSFIGEELACVSRECSGLWMASSNYSTLHDVSIGAEGFEMRSVDIDLNVGVLNEVCVNEKLLSRGVYY